MPTHYIHGQNAPSGRLFGRQRPLHAIFGGGNVADTLLWRDKYRTGAILMGLTVIWFLFEVVEYHFVTLLCHILMILMLILFVWTRGAGLIKRDPPSIDDIRLSDTTLRFILEQFNSLLMKLYVISSGKDLKLFIGTIISLWISSVIGSYISSLNLLYIVFLSMGTLPALYEIYEGEVDSFAGKSSKNMQRIFKDINTNLIDKIPRGEEEFLLSRHKVSSLKILKSLCDSERKAMCQKHDAEECGDNNFNSTVLKNSK